MSGTIGNILSIAASGLRSHRTATNVTSNNIANASTPGYSRQRAILTPNPPISAAGGLLGTGVNVGDVARVRDQLLDITFREESASAASFGEKAETLAGIEAAIGESAGGGLSAALDVFWSAWNDLAANPANSGARSALQQSGRELAATFQQIDGAFDSARQTSEARLRNSVSDFNQLARQIAELNQQIFSAEAGGQSAAPLRDQRDVFLDGISELSLVNAFERPDGTVGVYFEGHAIVDGNRTRTLDVSYSGGVYGLELDGRPVTAGPEGAIGAHIDLLNNDVPALAAQVDTLAAALIDAVNTAHQSGTNPIGNTAVDFFDPAGLTAGTISLSADVDADAEAIAAGTPDGAGLYQPGQNDIALQIAGLRSMTQASLSGMSIDEFYGDFTTQVGLAVASADSAFQVHDTMRYQADVRRSEMSGVSIDEEMVDLIRHQQAFTASARLVSVADDMLQTVLGMV